MNTLDKKYTDLLQDILDNGVRKEDRTGTGTLSVFGRQIRHNMKDGFPLITTKKMAWKTMVTELLWFLRGETNIKYLVDNDCHIWDGDCYKNFTNAATEIKEAYESGDILGSQPHIDKMFSDPNSLTILTKEEFINKIKTDVEFADEWGDLGKIYGAQWRGWKTYRKLPKDDYTTDYRENEPIDQIANLINDLKTNPDSRRLMVNAWNVGELDSMVLPPCHYGFQVYTRELSDKERIELMGGKIQEKYKALIEQQIKHCDEYNIPKRAISLMWNQRSVDTFLGLPFNIASYGLLLEIIAKVVNMVPDELIGNLGDTHLYSNHIEQAKEQIGRELTYKERYDIWFENNYQTGMEYNLDVEQDFNNNVGEDYMTVPPYRSREPFPLPTLVINDEFWNPDTGIIEQINHINPEDFEVRDYQSHPTIKAPLSN